jgi:hypothetical protein
VRVLLLISAVIAATWTFHRTELSSGDWKRTGAVCLLLCLIASAVLFWASRTSPPQTAQVRPQEKAVPEIQRPSTPSVGRSPHTESVAGSIRPDMTVGKVPVEASHTPPGKGGAAHASAPINSCPNGICISGGTVTNPTVNNGPPPVRIRLTPVRSNQFGQFSIINAPGLGWSDPQALYRSVFRLSVEAPVPRLVVTFSASSLASFWINPGTDEATEGGSWLHMPNAGVGQDVIQNAYGTYTAVVWTRNDEQTKVTPDCQGVTCIGQF